MPEDSDWHRQFELLKESTQLHPDDGLAWSALGDFLYRKSENPGLAVCAYERARELLPSKDFRLRLGRAYVSSGEPDKGFAMMRASAEERPRAEAYCILSDTYYRCGREADAQDAARAAIRLEPSFEEGYYLLGEALKKRDRAGAIEAYRTAISIDRGYALAWQALGRELVGDNRVDEGVDALTTAVRLGPDDVWSRALMANALWRAGRFEEAEEQYRAAMALAPDFPELKQWYDEFSDRRGESTKGDAVDSKREN